jgi:hypothetical protein
MISDRSAYEAAIVLIRQFGEDAVMEAARRADRLAADEDIDGQLGWARVMQAAETLLRKRTPDDPVN